MTLLTTAELAARISHDGTDLPWLETAVDEVAKWEQQQQRHITIRPGMLIQEINEMILCDELREAIVGVLTGRPFSARWALPVYGRAIAGFRFEDE